MTHEESDTMSPGFDNEKYIRTQSEHIKERVESVGGKLYLEFGGKPRFRT